MTIFLDACIIIYLIEAREPFFSLVQKRLALLAARHTNPCVAISRLSILECLVNPLRRQDIAIVEQYRSFFNRKDLTIVELSADVIEKALGLRARHNLGTPDALQAASALSLGGNTVLVSADRAFTRIKELAVDIV